MNFAHFTQTQTIAAKKNDIRIKKTSGVSLWKQTKGKLEGVDLSRSILLMLW